MKNFILFLILSISVQIGISQNHLKSYFNSSSQVYGGMEDGGISGTESYYFKVLKNLQLIDVMENGKNLQLNKGDTLIVSIHFYTPYNNDKEILDSTEIKTHFVNIDNSNKFTIYRDGRCIYLNADSSSQWNKCLNYTFKSKTYSVCAKEGFDSKNTSYAP